MANAPNLTISSLTTPSIAPLSINDKTFYQLSQRLIATLVLIPCILLSASLYASSSEPLPAEDKKTTITVAINEITFQKYQKYLNLDFCQKLPSLEQVQVDRNLLDFYLVCLALTEMGVEIVTKFIPSPSYARTLKMIEKGEVFTTTETVWYSDTGDHLHYSQEIVRSGEFEKGIYVYPRHELLSTPSEDLNFSEFTAITSSTWVRDISILNAMTPDVHKTTYINSRFRMLKAKRVDFTLMEFSSLADLSITQDDITLVPVPGIKVTFPGSRRFIFSKHSSYNDQLHTIIDKGISKLRQQGAIYRIYVQGGFINEHVKDWKIMNTNEEVNGLSGK